MIRTTSIASLALASLSSVQAQSAPALPDVLTADIIAGLGNNTLFNRWRPTYHFNSPAGWLNVCIIVFVIAVRNIDVM